LHCPDHQVVSSKHALVAYSNNVATTYNVNARLLAAEAAKSRFQRRSSIERQHNAIYQRFCCVLAHTILCLYYTILCLKKPFPTFYTMFRPTRCDRCRDRSRDRSRRSVARPIAATIASCKQCISCITPASISGL